MASLVSEEKDCPSILQISAGAKQIIEKSVQDECWQHVEVTLQSGDNKVNSSAGESCSLCRTPADEMEGFALQLEDLLRGTKHKVNFEPSEPSFELNFERSRRAGIKVEAWIDAGNAKTGFYTWDAAGIRFFTTEEHLAKFINELRREFELGAILSVG
ncbi:MAG: hypothetical protein K2X81_10945 [Candidatus Obscuribacterales bacterium]|nr:hypothetical protein [Candidatus Obscuribacterales bacterium]